MLKYMIVSLVVAAVGVAALQTKVTAPASLLDSAGESPVALAMALAHASIPSGLEIREPDDLLPSSWPPSGADPKRTVLLTEQVKSFNAQRQDYRAGVMKGGATVIRPAREAVAFLDQPSKISPAVSLAGPIAGSGTLKGEGTRIVLDGSDERWSTR